ncbi:MAG: hypothetical protein ACREF0_16500, partial [Acetobacteraceae bacterium]
MGKRISALLVRLKTDGHLPIALLVFAVTTVYHFVTHRDLGANYVSSIYAMYAFLAGHAIGQ